MYSTHVGHVLVTLVHCWNINMYPSDRTSDMLSDTSAMLEFNVLNAQGTCKWHQCNVELLHISLGLIISVGTIMSSDNIMKKTLIQTEIHMFVIWPTSPTGMDIFTRLQICHQFWLLIRTSLIDEIFLLWSLAVGPIKYLLGAYYKKF